MASDALRALRGLLEFYLYIVFTLFHSGPPIGTAAFDEPDSGVSPHSLRQSLKALHATVVRGGGGEGHGSGGGGGGSGEGDTTSDILEAGRHAAAAIAMDRLRSPLDSQPLFGLASAVCGMESLRNLAELFTTLKPTIAMALESGGSGLGSAAAAATGGGGTTAPLVALLQETLGPVPFMCTQIYRGAGRNLLALEPIVSSIRNKAWTPKEAQSTHNTYVDQILGLVQQVRSASHISQAQPQPSSQAHTAPRHACTTLPPTNPHTEPPPSPSPSAPLSSAHKTDERQPQHPNGLHPTARPHHTTRGGCQLYRRAARRRVRPYQKVQR